MPILLTVPAPVLCRGGGFFPKYAVFIAILWFSVIA